MSAIQLVSTMIAGAPSEVCHAVNRMGLAQYVASIDLAGFVGGAVVIFRVPADKAVTIRRLLDYPPEAWDNPPPYELFAGIGEK